MTKHWVDKAVGKQSIYIGGGNAKMVQPLCRGIWQYTTKLNLFFNSAIPLLGIYAEDTLQKYENTYASTVTALLVIAKYYKLNVQA